MTQKWLNKYFAFSKREYNGLLALIFLILIIMTLPYLYHYIWPDQIDHRLEKVALNQLMTTDKSVRSVRNATYEHKNYRKNATFNRPLFFFDPNTATEKEWMRLGLSQKQSAGVLKYIAKGGRFRKKEDLKRMYTIDAHVYEQLAPYVHIATEDKLKSARKMVFSSPEVKKTEAAVVELNGADSSALDGVRGIGPAFAQRILRYRERLGGFYQKEQLMEVFGLDSVKYLELKGQLSVDLLGLKKIAINRAEFDDLKNHPYLKYKQVNALIQYRKQHGNYNSVADLNKVAILDPQTINRLAPYLIF